jgi:hypothetical protein
MKFECGLVIDIASLQLVIKVDSDFLLGCLLVETFGIDVMQLDHRKQGDHLAAEFVPIKVGIITDEASVLVNISRSKHRQCPESYGANQQKEGYGFTSPFCSQFPTPPLNILDLSD